MLFQANAPGNPEGSIHRPLTGTRPSLTGEPASLESAPSRRLSIGLINNMPDGALEATERQFTSLLTQASHGFAVSLHLYALPTIRRGLTAARFLQGRYVSVDELADQPLDGLIVSGAEPIMPSLIDEPYWYTFGKVVEWAATHTYSTIWSCLAAHAAVLKMDGIARVRNSEKHFGILKCARLTTHPLTRGLQSSFDTPHSRWNGVLEDDLVAHGYRVLTRTTDSGADTFVKEGRSLFVFFQGHPEYEVDTLLREYRRDVARFAQGERATRPPLPSNYFDPETTAALKQAEERALSLPRDQAVIQATGILTRAPLTYTWGGAATCVYRNWLEEICRRKAASSITSNRGYQDIPDTPVLLPHMLAKAQEAI